MLQPVLQPFDVEIGALRGLISEMGGRAEAAIERAMEALVRHDLEGARAVLADDRRIDALEAEVERLAVQIIAQRPPTAERSRSRRSSNGSAITPRTLPSVRP